MSDTPTPEENPTHVEKVGAFDIRNFIAALIGLYGVVLTILGLVAFNAEESARTGGVNANLWAGLAMVVFAALFFVWAKLEPLKVQVDDRPGDDTDADADADAGSSNG